MKNRNISIDIIKGIGIILMVGGHCGMPFTHFIYLFHMASSWHLGTASMHPIPRPCRMF